MAEPRAATVDFSQFYHSTKDRHVSQQSTEIVNRLNPTLPSMMVRGTAVGAVVGAIIGSIQASWKDVPNEYGLKRLDRRTTLKLIGKSVLFWSIMGNGLYTTTTLVENFLKISSPQSLSFWGAFVFVSGYASVKARSFTIGTRRGALAGLTCLAMYPFWSVAAKRDLTMDPVPAYGVLPAITLKSELKERRKRTRPMLAPERPFWNPHMVIPDPRDAKLNEGAWDPPQQPVDSRVSAELYNRYRSQLEAPSPSHASA